MRWTRIRSTAPAVLDGEPRRRRAPALRPRSSTRASSSARSSAARAPRPRAASERELLETLAPQAALAINNARLAADWVGASDEIKAQADELAASRSRIVAAEEAARRQIERDIHDGTQQELVALIARIGLAQNQLGARPRAASTTRSPTCSSRRGRRSRTCASSRPASIRRC